MEDLNNYTVSITPPISTFYQGYEILGAPPPFGGVVVEMALNIVELYNFPKLGFNKESIHYMLEAFRFGYSDRMILGDPNFVPGIDEIVSIMLNKEHAALLRQKIDPNGRFQTFPPPYYEDIISNYTAVPDDHGTSHVSVVDKNRNAVSITSTINTSWGSEFLSPSTGMLMNDEMDDFSTPNVSNSFGYPPSVSNFIYPYKQPMSSMSPTIVTKNNKVRLVVGASGGSTIITTTFQVIMNAISYGMNILESISRPRLHDQLIPNNTIWEESFNSGILSSLKEMGYLLNLGTTGVSQGVFVDDDNVLYAASDWRKMGQPAGY